MKILQVTPVWPSAITVLAKQIVKHNSDIDIKLVTFHPKRPDAKEIVQVKELWKWADLIDMQYWKSAAKIRETIPNLWNSKKKMISHYNPYNLNEEKWEDYVTNIVVNSYQQSVLPQARMIPICIDLDFFTFNRGYYPVEPIVNMSVSRIESKKGVLQVAQACKELNYKFILVGRISDGEYMDRVKKAGAGVIDFRNNVSDAKVKEAYFESSIHVCNSKDHFESGTMPILESMACGVPVLTRRVGHVPDLYNGKNMVINEAGHEDVESIKKHLQEMMSNRKNLVKIRVEAAETVKERSDKWRAAEYRKVYEELISK